MHQIIIPYPTNATIKNKSDEKNSFQKKSCYMPTSREEEGVVLHSWERGNGQE
jgi:hypothetical protein